MSSPSNVPYQAYKSKRHSRNLSNPPIIPSASPPPGPRLSLPGSNGNIPNDLSLSQKRSSLSIDLEKHIHISTFDSRPTEIPNQASTTDSTPQCKKLEALSTNVVAVSAESPPSANTTPSPAPSLSSQQTPPFISPPVTPDHSQSNGGLPVVPEPVPSPPSASSPGSSPKTTVRRVSTFRHIPLRNGSTQQRPLASSPLRPAEPQSSPHLSISSRQLDPFQPRPTPASPASGFSSLAPTPLLQPVSNERELPSIPALDHPANPSPVQPSDTPPVRPFTSQVIASPAPSRGPAAPAPPAKLAPPTPNPSQVQAPSPALSPSSSTSSTPAVRQPARSPAPYRQGFQPKGVYRHRTDEYTQLRKAGRDVGRVERTRLERRLDKLINLHFAHSDQERGQKTKDTNRLSQLRRQSSIFDLTFNDLKGKSAGELWKEVIAPQPAPGSKADIRSSEQAITPWESDASVSQCPLCNASFHPLTNRKHHCRLCGRIICSLPVKFPQRPQTCSLLFVADPKRGQIEEVSEGVDYGVRRRTSSLVQGKGKARDPALQDEDKFLRGVRICRDCRPVLLRRQYIQEIHRAPMFSRLYDAFVLLEKEIEDALPQFQELMLNLNNDQRPLPEASAARKRLLEAFAQYDALAKRIHKLPCPGGQGSSQDRVQTAILTRANLFLQKNMFPLQAIPKPKKASSQLPASTTPEPHLVDPDSEIAHALQPLLEQEALLESFVEEAKAHRKFEDAKTLKANLAEIRAEIDRILANAESNSGSDKGKGRS